MPFHRLAVPSYSGGLPGTHDYINDPAANGDPGSPAPVDGPKGSGTNEGTYFVAFEEPAFALAVNRPAQALAENTDFLDDVIHRDLAVPAFLDVAAGHGGTSSVVLTGATFVGSGGLANTQAHRNQLVQFVDPTTGAPLSWQSAAGPPVVHSTANVSLIHLAAVNQLGNGFVTNPTADLAVTIPTAVAFRVLYYVRGRVKDQPSSFGSRLQHVPIGVGQIQADLNEVILNMAGQYQANTFITGLTQTFQGPVTLANATALTKPATTPAFTSDGATLKRELIFEFRVSETGDDVYARLYKLRDDGALQRGFEFTYNAKYVSDSAPEWQSDNTTANHHPTRWRFLGAPFLFQGEGFFYEVLDNSVVVGGTWSEGDWGASSVRSSSITGGSIVSGDRRVTPAAFTVAFGPAGAPDAAAENPYKLLFQAPTSGAQRIRIYAGNDDDAAGTAGAGLGHLVIVHNAVWNASTRLWSHDDNTRAALALCFRSTTNPNPGISGLSGAVSAGPDSHGGSAFILLVRNPGAGTWNGQSWTKTSGSSGHLRVAGEYAYASSVGGKEMIYWVDPLHWIAPTGSDWVLDDGLVGVAGGPGQGVFWSCPTASDWVYVPLDLPFGSKISQVSAEVDPITATAGNRMKIQLMEQDVDTRDVVMIGDDETDGTSGIQTLAISSGLPHYMVSDRNYFLRVRHATSAGTERLFKVGVTYVARVNPPGHGRTNGFTFVP